MLTGLWINPDNSAKDILACIDDLDRSGIGQIWLGDEGVARDPFVLLGAAANRTEHIELALGVTNPILRHPGVVAAAASTLAELNSGRFILGWGTGGSESLGPFSLKCPAPLDTISRAIRTSRAVLEGRRTQDYDPPAHAVPSSQVRQYIGARGPRLNELASQIADGVFLSGIPSEDLESVIAKARSHRTIDVALYQTVCSSGSERPGVMVGSTETIAQRLSEMIVRHSPTSIGIACIDDVALTSQVDFALDILDRLGNT